MLTLWKRSRDGVEISHSVQMLEGSSMAEVNIRTLDGPPFCGSLGISMVLPATDQ